MKLRYTAALTFIIFGVCIMIGLRAKKTYLDFNQQEKPLEQFMIGLLPDELVDVELDVMKHDTPLGKSNYILAVVCESDTIFRYDNLSQRVKVKKVFQGEGVSTGDEIEVSRQGSCVYLDENMVPDSPGKSVNLNFVNVMKVGKTYLVFLQRRIEGMNIYVGSEDYFLAPCFCYEDIRSVAISSISKEGNFAKYADCSQNEFFCTSQSAIQKLVEYKEVLLEKYSLE